jgi:hypothetical protein
MKVAARTLVLGLAIGGLTGCSSPSQPATTSTVESPGAPSAHPLAGLWVGTGQALSCSGPTCSSWVTYPMPPRPFTLSVLENAGRFTALLDIEVIGHLQLELTGQPQADGSVLFSGSARPPAQQMTGTADMHRFEVKLDPVSGLAGDFAYSVLWPTGTSDVSGRIVSAKRTLVSPREGCGAWTQGGRGCFGGSWNGGFIITSVDRCDGGSICKSSIKVGNDQRLDLTLDESGAVISGRALAWSSVPVTGATDHVTALLDGRIGPVPCGYPGFDVTVVCSEVIEKLSISLDQYGRMIGTLRYSREGWNGSSGGTQYYSFAVTGELLNVVRRQ